MHEQPVFCPSLMLALAPLWLAAQAGRVAALDVSDELLARVRDLNPDLANVRWELGAGERGRPAGHRHRVGSVA
ncbi:MAG: hypothetical protein M3022_12825 [Actinomycetota bacterium]|nr:hypothetical protein [Actinomycetota bacterium]